MKYLFNEDYDLSIIDRILNINNVSKDSLDITDFDVDYKLDVLNNFKNKLLAYKDKKFLIVGDYDCDGICATAIISLLLKNLNIAANYYIPSRIKEGYGLNDNIVYNAYNNHFDCLICVDNGIVATSQLSLAKQLGIKVFIIDHHEYLDEPNCVAYLHPVIFPEKYKDMCAGGLSCFLANSFGYDDFYTALGGLATLGDMVEVFNYNRYLLNESLNTIKANKIYPISLLLGNNEVSFSNLAFNVIPKLNAVSRLDDLLNVNYLVKFLLAKGSECLAYFDKIENINDTRKQLSKQMYSLATRLIDSNSKVIVVASDEFKEGLCGLLANRILENYNKPTIVLAKVGNMYKGSARSPVGINLYEYLLDCKNMFSTYGGHEMALGLSFEVDKLDELLNYINTHELDYQEPSKDVLLVRTEDINFDLLKDIESLNPYGSGFKNPLIGIKNPKIENKTVINHQYPKFVLNKELSAISFNSKLIDKDFEYMIGHLQNDNYHKSCLSLLIEDLV